MAAMTMDREPEMARFIDTYKFDQDMSNKRDRFGGGTSLPLNSDGYEDKQRALREERHRDWMVQQDKPKDPAVYYRLGTPEQGFPGLGSYQKQRQENNKMRQKEYNSLLRKQKQTEQEKLMNRHRSPPRPAQPQGPQVDYNLQGEQARAEEKRAYQDYMGKYQYNANAPPKPTFDYEENKKILNEERKREYNQLMDKKAKEERYWQMRGRPVTPPGGLNIGAYDKQLKETAAAKKKEYKEMLDQQQKEHMYLRARQEPEMAVIDRNAPQQYLANKPPPGPGYRPREENEERRRMEEEKHYQQASKPAQVVKNQYYSSDDYEKFQKEIAKEQSKEYQEFLAKQYQPPTDAQGLPLGQYRYEPKRLAMEKERNKEYNQLLEKKYGKSHSRSSRSEPDRDRTSFYYGNDNFHDEKRKMLDDERKNEYNQFVKELKPARSKSIDIPTDAESGLPIGQQHHEAWRKFLRDQRKHEYEEHVDLQKQKHPDRRNDYNGDVSGGPYSGLFQGLGDHGNKSDLLNQERKREYNEQYAGKEKMTGRPNWARETLPNNSDRGRSSPMKSQPPTDQYQQMLDEKRREEAGRRRYDDPEYQGRLAESRERERGEAGPRYGGY